MEHINLIRSIAWSFHKTTGLEWEELFQEASLGYCLALRRFNPDKGMKLTSHLYRGMSCHLINYLRKNKRVQEGYSGIAIESLIHVSSKNGAFETSDCFERLTKEAQEIVDLVLSLPEIFGKENPKKAQQHIVNILKKRGWEQIKIEGAMQNLKMSFS